MADEKLIERLAATTEGNALAHFRAMHSASQRSGWTKDAMLAASGYAIAASYWSLIDSMRSAVAYWIASSIYRDRGHSYWMPLALASSRADVPAKVSGAAAETNDAPPAMIAFAMVGEAMLPDRHSSQHLDLLWRHTGNVPVGRLGIPLGMYRRCSEAMAHQRPDLFRVEAQAFLRRMSEAMELAAHDRFHWDRMHSAVLPAEPEAVAMAAAMSRVAQERFGVSIREMVREPDEHMERVLVAGEGLHHAASGAVKRLSEELQYASALAGERNDPTRDDDIALRVAQLANLLPDELPVKRLIALMHEYESEYGSAAKNAIAAQMRALAFTMADQLQSLTAEGALHPAAALAALSILELRPAEDSLDWIAQLFRRTDDRVVLTHTAWALVRAARDLPEAALPRVAEIIRQLQDRIGGDIADILRVALEELKRRG